jgi:hypothetical protein
LQEEYEESRRRLGISEEKIWVQRTPIGQALVVYWDTEDPQRTLREIANAQDEFGKRFKQLIQTAAPALDLSGSNRSLTNCSSRGNHLFPRRPLLGSSVNRGN